MQHTTFQWHTFDALELFAQSWRPQGKALGIILLIHGIGEHSSRYVHLADFFTKAGFIVSSYDQRGHGKSAGKRGHIASYEAILKDIDDAIAHMRVKHPALPLFLYGHSMGGNFVLNYILSYKNNLAGAVVSSPALKTFKAPPFFKLLFAKLLRKVYPSLTLSNDIQAKALTRSPSIEKRYEKDPLIHNRVSIELGLSILERGLWALEHAHTLSMPLLLLHGMADRVTSAQASIEFMQQTDPKWGTLKCYDGLYHELHNEPEQEMIFSEVLAWLKIHTTMK